MTLFSSHNSMVLDAVQSVTAGTQHWSNRWAIAWYVDRCVRAGFCKTINDAQLCAQRYIAGKRKVSPPGTARRKKLAKEQELLRKNIPVALLDAVEKTVGDNLQTAVKQFSAGNEKAVNALIGKVMKIHKADAVIIKELLIEAIKKFNGLYGM